jgi:WD40-like Beta Propeller Repeat
MRTRTTGAFRATWVAFLTVSAALGTALLAQAQTPFVPYFGKNLVHYGNFDWQIYTTDHFEIYYYSGVQPHLERVAGYAESAYQTVSADLKHDLAFKVPLILFKTHVEFEQQNVIPGAAQEGVAAFAEPTRNRLLLPLDEPPDLLYRTITHELTHIFEFDIVPQSLIRREEPLWINEGLSDYETGYWAPLDLATVRDAAVADIVPKMSKLQGYGDFSNPRLIYNLGHASFEFMESRWGKEGIRQYLFSLRKSVIGGGESAYEEAFKLKADEFDQQFEKYLKDRFKPFRDKERPMDYGRDLAPDPEKTRFSSALTAEPSPTGDLIATVTGNRRDQEYDIILVSAKDGTVVRNLTPGFDKNMGFQYLSIPGTRWNTVPWLAWGPGGDRLAYFVRFGKGKGLVVEDVVTRKILQRVELTTVDEPESPCFSPDGKTVAFAGLQNAKSDLFLLNLETTEVTSLTQDPFYNYAPTFAPDGKSIVYLARVSGNEKLFRLDLATRKSTQITFGTHDDASARFIDADTIVFASTALDPTQSVDPEVARNGNIYNLWTLSLKSGELKEYTDSLGGNLSPVPLKDAKGTEVAFITYYKGQYGLHTMDLAKPLKAAATADFGAPGPIIDFQAPLSHTLVAENVRKKKTFEKMYLDGRPSVNLGVTNNGDVFGGTELNLTDVLGDHRFDFTAGAIMQYTTFAASYMDVSRRFQWAVQGIYQKLFYYGNNPYYYDPLLAPLVSRSNAEATRSVKGASVFGIYPLDAYRRLEVSGGFFNQTDSYNDQSLAAGSAAYPGAASLDFSGSLLPLTVAFVQETTVFREFGPLAGNTLRVSYEAAPKVGALLSRQTIDADLRYYQRLFGTGVLAFRFRGFKSTGDYPDYMFFGGLSEMRGYDYLEFIGQNVAFGNVELRFPIVEAMLTPIGILGGIRGVFFFDIGAGWFKNQGFQFASSSTQTYQRQTGVALDANGNLVGLYDPPVTVSGFRLQDARASYGLGLETFVLGFPMHFDWAWRTTFNKSWEDALMGPSAAADWRKPRFSFWIGYDW